MNILGIETSCDETSAAVVQDGKRILSNVIASQVDLHARFGGIVPEVASRQHILQITPILRRALEQAGVGFDQIDAVAVTAGPGLAGALLVGVNAAKAIAFARGVPLIGVNHLEAHIYANWLSPNAPSPVGPVLSPAEGAPFPLVCLIASGGHTDLVLMRGHGDYQVLGRTRDDAAGEAFDKAARVLGLGYPGGPLIQRIAEEATEPVPLPRAWLKGTHDFSFSGLKTAVLHLAQSLTPGTPSPSGMERGPGGEVAPSPSPATRERDGVRALVANIAAGFQESVVDVLVEKTVEAASQYAVRCVLLAGGVAANRPLRTRLLQRSPVPVVIPPFILCTDNAAMIACCGHYRLQRGQRSGWDLDVVPNWKVGERVGKEA